MRFWGTTAWKEGETHADIRTSALRRGLGDLENGNYFFTTPEGDEVKVEYSFGYLLDEDGNVRINLHHSSMPFGS